MASAINVLIVAVDPLVRSGLAVVLDAQDDCNVVFSTSPARFWPAITDDDQLYAADLILWDLGWESGELNDLDFREFDLPVITLVADDSQAVDAWNTGAISVLSREIESSSLLSAFRAILKGLVVLDPNVTVDLLSTPPQLPDDLVSAPTARELEVLKLLAEGLTNRALAARLDISEHTVKFHVNAILKKLDAQSRTEAVVIATRLGFIAL